MGCSYEDDENCPCCRTRTQNEWPDWLRNFYLSEVWSEPFVACQSCAWRFNGDGGDMDKALPAMELHWNEKHA